MSRIDGDDRLQNVSESVEYKNLYSVINTGYRGLECIQHTGSLMH